ncbi:MAG: S9 family peptidase [Gammaproteobacteria bacterium]|nr:S9 family peptidase [Gammaproteobacteria bacterium]
MSRVARFAWMAAAWLAAVAPGYAAGATSSADTPRPLGFEDQEAVRNPTGIAISPDGKQVAYVVKRRIYVVPVAGGEPRAVSTASSAAWDPTWSRDGRALFFLSDRSGSSQLWKLSLAAFGEAEQVTEFAHGIDRIRFSPDESRLLLSFTDTQLKPAEQAEAAVEGEGGKDKVGKPFVITRLEFKEDAGEGYLTGDRTEHLHVLDLATGQLAQVTSGPYTESDAAWSPDGRRIVFVSNREQNPDVSYRTDLWIADAVNTDKGATLQRLTDDERTKSNPVFSPDKQSIAFLVAADGVYGAPQVAVVPAAGGDVRVLTAAHDRWVNDFRFTADGEWIYFAYENLGGNQVARVRPRDGRLEQVITGQRGIGEFAVAQGGAIVARVETGNRAPELAAFAGGRETALTRINEDFHARVALGAKESVHFKAPDGTDVQVFVTRPPGFVPGRRYPTVLHIHGGPVAQFAWGFDFKPQYLAAQGYVVVEPNPRGSTGRGEDFVRAIYRTWGITDYDDLIAAVDHVIAAGYADPERLAVTGYSYGGYMTNVAITRTDRFKAAATGAGHSYIVANYGHDIYQKWYNWELGPPWENREKYDKLSPLLQAGRVTTPTIFLGGREDWNVPMLNAELFYQSLRTKGVPTELIVYPGAHHGGWPKEFERDYLERVTAWFDRYLK